MDSAIFESIMRLATGARIIGIVGRHEVGSMAKVTYYC